METARRTARGSRRRRSGSPLFGQLLTAAVESAAAEVAIRFNPSGDLDDDRQLTYAQLDTASSRLARELIDRGVGPGDVVALGIARSLQSVVAVWAIAKTGAAFVPVDPAHPTERINHVLADSGAVFGLTTSAHRPVLGTGVYWIELDDPVQSARIAARPEHPISYTDRVRPLDERHPAYVIYSGDAAGRRPTGVVVTHTGLAGLVAAEREHYDVSADSRMLHGCSPNVDLSVLELLLAFSSGATLVIAPPSVVGGGELADLLRRERVTHLLSTPGTLASVDPAGLDDLRVVVVAGEKFNQDLLGRWAADREFFHGYGPTEATILATSTGQLVPDEAITIGSAIPGVGAFVLDSRLRPVPLGVVGELYLSGPALAQGYLGRQGSTAERFVASPYGADTGNPGARLFRTGDLVRRMPSALGGDAFIRVLDEIPLTSAGMPERQALPVPVFAAKAFRAPSTPVEQVVADVFAALLTAGDQGRIGIDDDFFALGGTSLLAAQAADRIGSALRVRVPARLVFAATTVAALAERVEQHAGSVAGQVLQARPRQARVPMSYAQQRMWFLNRFDPASAVDNIPAAVRLTGLLDLDALRAAISDVVARHEVLRTRYPEVDGAGHQQVLPHGDPGAVPEFVVAQASASEVPGLIAAAVTVGFDVTAAPPVRLRLLELSETDRVLICVVHNIAGDGFSMVPLIRDLMAAYLDRVCGSAPEWPALEVQYADYAIWQREVLGTADDPESVLAEQLQYWRTELAGLPEQMELPADRPRPTVASHRGATLGFEIDADVHAALNRLAHSHDSTLFVVLHAALAVLLARLSGTRDIAIGTQVAGRDEAALDGLIGTFVNTLVLRTEVDSDAPFDDLLREARRVDTEALGHADVPFARLVELLAPARSTARHPLFQVLLTFQNLAGTELELPGLSVSAIDIATPLRAVDLQLELAERIDRDDAAAGISAIFSYATDLFDEATIQDFADRFGRILAAVAADSAVTVGDIDVLAPGERALVLHEWNSRGAMVPEVTLVDLIAAQARRRPHAAAIRFGDTTLTFGELYGRANQVARALIARGAGPESLVAVAVPRTDELPVALLAVLAAGAGYLPIDTTYPEQRRDFLLADAAPACILTTVSELESVPAGDIPVIVLADTAEYADTPIRSAERTAPLRPDNLACVIYTSGSTGVPKGVGVTHRNVVQLFANTQTLFDFDETDVWTLFHSFAFDFSVWELWCALANGGTVVVVDQLTCRSPELLRELLIREQVTVLNQTPSAFYRLAEADRAAHTDQAELALRYVVCGGEALDLRQLPRWYDRHAADAPWLVNMYGITETTVHVSFLPLDEELVDNAASVIGRALPGLDAVVLDDRLHPSPVGVAGEMYVAGAQLSRGYLGRPALTAARFVANPFGAPGSRMYRTGDIGRWVGFGGQAALEYAGRGDQQVQLRGFRIELGEIESALLRCQDVSQAVVLVHADEHAGDRLIGYVVPDTGTTLDPDALRGNVAEFLTGQMVPDALVVLDQLPLTPNGKLDRKALPAPEFIGTAMFRAPSSPVEQAVAEVFGGLLGAGEIGLDDDFFTLGGNSLLATRVVARINAALDANLAVRELFESPTVVALAARVVPGATEAPRPPLARAPHVDRVPLSLAQQRMWALNQADTESAAYNIPLAIRLTGGLDVPALRHAVADVLERHETLRTRYPTDPSGQAYQEILSVTETLPGGLEVSTTADPLGRIAELMATGFDVTRQVPVRAMLLSGGSDDHLLALVVHHIAADSASMTPLARDLMTAYLARVGGNSPRWSPMEVQYADFAIWQRAVIGADDDENSLAAKQLAYWRAQLDGLSGEIDLPLDRPRPDVGSMRGATTGFAMPPEVHEALVQLAREHNSTLFTVVHAALAVLLAMESGSTDIAIGTAIAGRGEPALEDLVGMLDNTLTLRTTVDPSASFAALVDQSRITDLGAFANADIPFERVAEVVAAGSAAAQQPLFGVVLSFQNDEQPTVKLPGLTVTGLDSDVIAAKVDLQVNVDPRHHADGTFDELVAVITYATDLFDESTVQALNRGLARILATVVADPQIRVGDIDLLDPEEPEQVDAAAEPMPEPGAHVQVTAGPELEFGPQVQVTAEPMPELSQHMQAEPEPGRGDERGTTITGTALTQALTAIVEDDPDGPALVSGEDAMSYQELDARSSRLARVLAARGCGPGDGVALRFERGVDAVVATWAVLKAGAAVVPVASVRAPIPAGPEVKIGLTAGAVPAAADLDWLVLDDPAVAAQIAAESPRPMTYAHRTRVLRGSDPVFVGDRTFSYGELAVAADRLRTRTELTFESRTFHLGGPAELALIEAVASGSSGASVVLVPDDADLATALGDEWVSHLLIDRASLDGLDPAALPDLQAVVLADGTHVGAAWTQVTAVISVADLLRAG
ncbi:non-ribosomal peptide synthetase [Nocardia altamirensis]|uniref:non-ribosomal peptide synthetase n=1 Tax=Nocardia altamirensis TaxID=472158 RepID=UPI000840154C|nr:non-ribosomal peptide synthetase [Nocardia altamirensis]